jgi:hypothetical protein
MVIKTTLPHSGWSYSKGDDQYENDSIGSTVNAKNLEKLAANSKKNDQNSYMKFIGSKDNKQHTNDRGWTRIDSNSNHKRKIDDQQILNHQLNHSLYRHRFQNRQKQSIRCKYRFTSTRK